MEDGHMCSSARESRERQFLRDFIAIRIQRVNVFVGDVRSKDYSNRDKKKSVYDKLSIIYNNFSKLNKDEFTKKNKEFDKL